MKSQGAQHVLNHREPDYLDRLSALTGGRGPDVIVENLANVNLDNDLSALAFGGRVVIVGNRGRIEIDPRKDDGKRRGDCGNGVVEHDAGGPGAGLSRD